MAMVSTEFKLLLQRHHETDGIYTLAVERATTTPNPTAILLHQESRECIRRLLLLIDRYASFVSNTALAPANKPVLEGYIKSILEDNAISIKAMVEFLIDLDDTDKSVKPQTDGKNLKAYISERRLGRGV
jgi:hypothetical protein